MSKKRYDKLVRDNIPGIIEARERKAPLTHIASEEEFREKLKEKLKEEVEEFISAKNDYERIEELADTLEVILAILEDLGTTREDLEKVRLMKEKERGAFKKRIILDEV